MSRILTRAYEERDRAAVLALFDQNRPEYFSAEERDWLDETLDAPDGPLFVVEADGEVAAFGGYELLEHYNRALIVWGMAARARHGQGFGRVLLLERLARIARETPATRWVVVDTSPASAPFFERNGFETVAVWPEGYRDGETLHELRLDLSAHPLDALDARLAAARQHAEAQLGAAP